MTSELNYPAKVQWCSAFFLSALAPAMPLAWSIPLGTPLLLPLPQWLPLLLLLPVCAGMFSMRVHHTMVLLMQSCWPSTHTSLRVGEP